jgi:hypothetical protein
MSILTMLLLTIAAGKLACFKIDLGLLPLGDIVAFIFSLVVPKSL